MVFEATHEAALSDEYLVNCLKEGRMDALSVLFERHYRKVLSVSLKITRDATDAEDILQEVFLYVMSNAGCYDPARATVVTWILQLAYYRSLSRRRTSCLEKLGLSPFGAALRAEARTDRCLGMHFIDCARLVEQSLATLSDKQRITIRLVHFEAYLLREVSEFLKEPLANIRNHYYRGLQRLERILIQEPTCGKMSAVVEMHANDAE